MEWLQWQDHVTEFEDRYTESKNDDGTITHKPVEGEVLQEGTPQNAQNFSNMQAWGIQGTEMAALALIGAMHNRQEAEDLAGDVMEVTLTNNETFPFNNSEKTISLERKRNHKNYTVSADVLGYSGGFPGEVVVSGKLENGFKIAFTGSARSVNLKVYVKGGFYR